MNWQRSFAPVVETPKRARDELRWWLAEQGWPGGRAAELVAAVNEAVTNVVEHAYPVVGFAGGVVTVSVESVEAGGQRRVRLRVVDDGWWQPRVEPIGPPEHFGLDLISGLMDEVWLRRGGIGRPGTEIVMLSRSVPDARG